MDSTLHQLAEQAGLQVEWEDAHGDRHEIGEATARALLQALGYDCSTELTLQAALESFATPAWPRLVTAVSGEVVELLLPLISSISIDWQLTHEDGSLLEGATTCTDGRCDLPAVQQTGYHALQIGGHRVTLAVAPQRCFMVADACGARAQINATSTQLYALRSARDLALGSGDFGALTSFCEAAAAHALDAVGISPVHAGFAADAQRFSPYAPSTRLFINVLAIDPVQVFGHQAVADALKWLQLADEQQRLERLELIEWPAVASLRLSVLNRLVTLGLSAELDAEFEAWRAGAGRALEHHARFEVLHALQSSEHCSDWRSWPAAYRDPDGETVADFAEAWSGEIRFHAILQWLARRGLNAAHGAAKAAGMQIGLIGDLAVGTDPTGSHGWSRQGDFLDGVTVGAPPDVLNVHGQDWGLTAFSPTALRAHGYAAFIEMLRASFASVGGLRIDHVLGLYRLWLVPAGMGPADGAYLRLPFDDLARLIALESWRHRAIVVGENLGTVPTGFNDRLARYGILGMDVLWFMRDADGEFLPAQGWQSEALATTTTHDLPTIAGWWAAREIDWRVELDQLGPDEREADIRRTRDREREALVRAIGAEPAVAAPVDEVITFIAAAPTPLLLIPVEDLLAIVEQPNLPGTTSGHPNWQRRLPCLADQCFDSPAVQGRLQRLVHHRSVAAGRQPMP